MTDVFNIDSTETEGFRKNNLDWRKFRENYNRVSAAKVERGITPLPLSLLLKLFGPQKVLNTYVVTRKFTNELDYYQTDRPLDIDCEMKSKDIDNAAVAKTLNFPGNGLFMQHAHGGGLQQRQSTSTKSSKHTALPPRPVFQRGIHVPGRYFPKPAPTEEYVNLSVSYGDNNWDRPGTQTPHSVHVFTPGSTSQSRASRASGKVKSGILRNSKVIRGTMCKATDTLGSSSSSSYKPARSLLSGKSTATVRSVPTVCSNEYIQSKKGYSGGSEKSDSVKSDMFAISFRNDERENSAVTNGNGSYDPHSEMHSDYYTVKRMKLASRQVSFPPGSRDFSTVLQGRPKTLHRRDMAAESLEAMAREPRARTHVGFVENDMT